jgi:hypothetical protein
MANFEILDSQPQGSFQILDAPPSQGFFGTLADKAGALGSGFNRAYLSRAGLPFNPVDAVANVLDLGKAAIGAPYIAITGNAPPAALQLQDRGDVVGSGQWLINQARKTGVGRAVLDAPNPADEGGMVQTIGAGAGAGVGGGASRAQEVANMAMGAGSAAASKGVYDATGSDALAIAAGMLPQATALGLNAAAKTAVRGNEQGRQDMAQRVQDLRNAGIQNPSVGLASGNGMAQGVENILASSPGSAGVMDASRKALLDGITGQVAQTADLASPNRGPFTAGTAIQSGLKGFGQDFKQQQGVLWDRLGRVIPSDQPTNVDQTKAALSQLNADIPGAPALSQFFKNGKIVSLQNAVDSDTGGTVPANPIGIGVDGRAYANTATLPTSTLPFQAVKQFRTLVGNEIADSNIASDVPRSKWNPLYGALSGDIRDTASAVGPEATNAFNRANNYTRAGMSRLDQVAPFADANSPERAYQMLMTAAANKGSNSVLQAVKKSVPEDARGTIASTVIDRLGTATPGKQNDAGSAWSPETFLTNWNSMSPASKNELFSGFPNSAQVRAQVDSIAKATSMLRDGAKIWANPSGTAPRLGAEAQIGGLLGAPILGLASGHPLAGLGTAAGLLGGMGATNLLARNMTNGGLLNYMVAPADSAHWLDPSNPSIPQQLVNIPGLLSSQR